MNQKPTPITPATKPTSGRGGCCGATDVRKPDDEQPVPEKQDSKDSHEDGCCDS